MAANPPPGIAQETVDVEKARARKHALAVEADASLAKAGPR